MSTEKSIEEIFESYFKNETKSLDKNTSYKKCCNNERLLNVNGEVLCKFCGQVFYYEMVNDFNTVRIKKKSIYQRKYHMKNILQTKIEQNYIYFTVKEMDEFISIFNKIELLFPQLYPSRKKFIKFDYLFHKILQFMNSEACKIFVNGVSKGTLKKYNEIWDSIKKHL